jgi:predicted N-formylglutamate amidohydrolase
MANMGRAPVVLLVDSKAGVACAARLRFRNVGISMLHAADASAAAVLIQQARQRNMEFDVVLVEESVGINEADMHTIRATYEGRILIVDEYCTNLERPDTTRPDREVQKVLEYLREEVYV